MHLVVVAAEGAIERSEPAAEPTGVRRAHGDARRERFLEQVDRGGGVADAVRGFRLTHLIGRRSGHERWE
jgi:hypothetical protein